MNRQSILAGLLNSTLIVLSILVLPVPGCISMMRSYENAALRIRFEDEFKSRSLDPIEGFWRSSNEFAEAVGVMYRTDPAANDGFPFAGRTISVQPKRALPYSPDFSRIGARLKPGLEEGTYHGQGLLMRGNTQFWQDITVRLIDATTAETTVHTTEPMLGGNTQRAYLVGPIDEMKTRLAMTERRQGAANPDLPFNSSGTGFLVAPTLVVTCNHVVQKAKSIQCIVNEEVISATVIATDKDTDLALLKLSHGPTDEVTIFGFGDSAEVRQGRHVFAMGFQITEIIGTKLSVNEGVVSSLSGLEGRGTQFQIEMSVHPGSSGGPVVDDRGCVVGVVTSKLGLGYLLKTGDVPQGMMFATKADLVRTIASSVQVENQMSFSCNSTTTRNLEETTASYATGVVRVESTR